MKKACFILLSLMFVLSAWGCSSTHCEKINDEIETNPNFIGSATVYRSNMQIEFPVRIYWRSSLELLLDINKNIGLGDLPFLPESSFYSDENHQWWICERSNGYRYAILRRISE